MLIIWYYKLRKLVKPNEYNRIFLPDAKGVDSIEHRRKATIVALTDTGSVR